MKITKIFKRFLHNTPKLDLLIYDDFFPGKLSAFRYIEFLEYFKHFEKTNLLISTKTYAAHVFEKKTIQTLIAEFENEFPPHINIIKKFHNQKLNAKIGYCIFINNISWILPTFEKNKIPFVFTLYPGGGFIMNNNLSDNKIRNACASPYFKGVIVTQKITFDYLISKNLCPKDKINLIYGVFAPAPLKAYNKILPHEKNGRFDICFVAIKYSPTGTDKGYDVFIEVCKKLAETHKNIYFHVLGGFDGSEIDISPLNNQISFYDKKESHFFSEFYQDKDLIISPNPGVKIDGAFDGFPTGCCVEAMLNQVPVLCTDELNQNIYFENGVDIILATKDVNEIYEKVIHYMANHSELLQIGTLGQKKAKKLFNTDVQIEQRLEVLKKAIL